jgi:hypothetical protein
MEFDPLKYYKDVGRQRIRIPAAIADNLQWPKSTLEVPCIAVFTAPGELMCADVSAKNANGVHPLSEAVARRQILRDAEDMSLGDLALATFVTSNRIFDFNAKWTKEKTQMHLDLGSAATLLLGWTSDGKDNPPIFPAVRDHILFLWSRARFEELLKLPIS